VFFNPGDTNGGTTPFWEFGWVAGGGAEVRLPDPKWFLRAEYLHYDFGDSGSVRNSTTTMDTATHTAVSVNTSGHLTVDVVRGGLSYKLN
jgi:outer membrane immunogenic protein